MGHRRARASTNIHDHHVRCTCRNRSWVHVRARASTSILCAAQVGTARGPIGDDEHPRAATSILRAAQVGIAYGPSIRQHPVCSTGRNRSWVHGRARSSTSIHEHPVRCTGRTRSWAHGRAPHPRASTSIPCAAQVGIAHVPMGEHPIHQHPRASRALHR